MFIFSVSVDQAGVDLLSEKTTDQLQKRNPVIILAAAALVTLVIVGTNVALWRQNQIEETSTIKPKSSDTGGRRVIAYVTEFDKTTMGKLKNAAGALTHVLVGLFHLGYENNAPYVHLNNLDSQDPSYSELRDAITKLQNHKVKVLGSLGGGGVGDFGNLFKDGTSSASYQTFVNLLVGALHAYNLDGIDLDIEEREYQVNTVNVITLIDDLRKAFETREGGFLITCAPVAAAMINPVAGVSPYVRYRELAVDFYILQFYNGWGNINPRGSKRTLL